MNGFNPNHVPANRRVHVLVVRPKRRVRVRTECGIRLRTVVVTEGAADCAVCLDTIAQRENDPTKSAQFVRASEEFQRLMTGG